LSSVEQAADVNNEEVAKLREDVEMTELNLQDSKKLKLDAKDPELTGKSKDKADKGEEDWDPANGKFGEHTETPDILHPGI
jgi:hypothetical protein